MRGELLKFTFTLFRDLLLLLPQYPSRATDLGFLHFKVLMSHHRAYSLISALYSSYIKLKGRRRKREEFGKKKRCEGGKVEKEKNLMS